MITISINDELRQFPQPQALCELVQHYQAENPDTTFAIAINGEFVPRAQYDAVLVNHGDTLDIVSPVGGG